MIRFLALFLAILALASLPARADLARVMSGEHADFTRLVVELPAEDGWTVGRTAMGYAFAAQTASQPGYDLSRVWQRIPKTRLQAIRVDPENGALHLALACACHVFPFEYRPGVIVLDIRNGPAPPGSAFEARFDLPLGADRPASPRNPAPSGYDWLDVVRPDAGADPDKGFHLPRADLSVSLDPLRDELLEQISRGAVAGVVDMELPGKPPGVDPVDRGELPWARIRIGDIPGVAIREGDSPIKDITAEGDACVPDASLALAEWGAGRPPLELLVEARSGLFGEFDAVNPDAVLHSVRLHLYLGFGAEAAQYAALLDGADQGTEVEIYASMARLVEGGQDPATPFARMLGCDGAAALWAALAHDTLPPGAGVEVDAIVRSFAALPPHLRRSLGAGLAGKLLDRGDSDAARMVRDAMERSADMAAAEVALLDARADLLADRPDAAIAHAERAIAGVGVKGLIALVEAHFQKAKPLAKDIPEALQAFRGEIGDPRDIARLDRALALALVLSGQTRAAIAVPLTDVGALSDLWHVVQLRSPDDDFLHHAVVPDRFAVPAVSGTVALAVASRLTDLAFPDAALAWLGPVMPTDAADRRRLAARAETARGDARQAITLLDGLTTPEDAALRALALVHLGEFGLASQAYAAAGMDDEADRLRGWAGDWAALTEGADPAWGAAAAAASPAAVSDAGPLAHGAALLDDSAAVRQAMAALLSDVATPDP